MPRIWTRQNASKLASFPGLILGKSFGDKPVEFPSFEIRFNLLVPNARVKRKKPRTEFCKVFRRQVLNPVLQLFYFTHRGPLPIPVGNILRPAYRVVKAGRPRGRRDVAGLKSFQPQALWVSWIPASAGMTHNPVTSAQAGVQTATEQVSGAISHHQPSAE